MSSLSRLPRPSASRLAVRVTPDALRRIRGGHPWLFDGSIESVKGDGKPGDLAVVFDNDRAFVAIGLYDPASPMRVKILHQGKPTTIDRSFWQRQLTAAIERRSPLVAGGDTTGYRVVNGESDGFPSLILDRYADTLVLKLYSPIWVPHLDDIVSVIDDLLHPRSLVLRHARNLDPAALHGLEEGDALLGTAPTEPVLFQEAGLTFEADVVRGQKTGHFLDQRDNRRLVGGLADGLRVLDVFAATGGFTVHAAAGGATDVVSVDISEPTLAAAARNLAHNSSLPAVASCRVRPIVGDAYEVMDRLHRNGERFDMVIIDPPSFTPRQEAVARALAAYERLTERGVRLVRPGGWYVQASCSSRVTADEFHLTVSHAAARAGRPLDEWRRTGHPLDHPATFPEGSYLKAVFAHVP